MKFKVGDRVMLKPDLEVGKSYGAIYLYSDMLKCGKDKELMVAEITPSGNYILNTLEGRRLIYIWSGEMLIPATLYKVGDKVRVRPDIKLGNKYGGLTLLPTMAEKIGHEFTVRLIDTTTYPPVYYLGERDGKSNPFAWSKEMLEPVKPYKKGDKVVPITKTVPGYEDANLNGTYSYIKEDLKKQPYYYVVRTYHYDEAYPLHKDMGPILALSPDKDSTEGNYFFPHDVIPYVEKTKKEEVKEETESKFKVGDKVRIIGSHYGWAGVKEGDIGTIRRIEEQNYFGKMKTIYRIDVPTYINGSCDTWRADIDDIEPYVEESHEKETKSIKEGDKKMPKYKVGDRVRLNTATPHHGLGTVTPNEDIGVIVEIVPEKYSSPDNPAYKVDFPEHRGWYGLESELDPVVPTSGITLKEVKEESTLKGLKPVETVPASEDWDEEEDYDEWDEDEDYDEWDEEDDEEDGYECLCDEDCENCKMSRRDYYEEYPEIKLILKGEKEVSEDLKFREMPVGEQVGRGIYKKVREGNGGIMKAFKNLFGTEIGKDTSGRIALSVAGMAIRNNEGKWVAFDGTSLIDVMDVKFDVDTAFYRVPVQASDVKVKDVIINQQGTPVIVVEVGRDGITVVNPYNGLKEVIVPSTNLLGMKFYVKVINLFGDAFGKVDLGKPESILPFILLGEKGSDDMLPFLLMANNGKDMNSMLPFLLLSKDGNKSDLLPLLLMGGFGKAEGFNPMLFLLMDKGGDNSMFETMLLMNAFGGNGFNLFGTTKTEE